MRSNKAPTIVTTVVNTSASFRIKLTRQKSLTRVDQSLLARRTAHEARKTRNDYEIPGIIATTISVVGIAEESPSNRPRSGQHRKRQSHDNRPSSEKYAALPRSLAVVRDHPDDGLRRS